MTEETSQIVASVPVAVETGVKAKAVRGGGALGVMARGVGAFLALAALAGIAALAFMPEPEIKRLGFVPRDVAVFFDRNDFLKNLLGFGALRLALAVSLAPFEFSRGWRGGARVTAWSLGLVVGLEAGQMFLPKRSFDWNDILAGGLGVMATGVLSATAGWVVRVWRTGGARGGAR